tara:strand:+ start:10025 stop:10666 length:642 start_codon:yes stop_codon:yes gene_type:complete
MEAIQRSILSNNWIVLILVFSIGILFFLKMFKTEKFKGYIGSLFNKGFIEIEAEEKYLRLSSFHLGFSFFSFLTLSVSIYFIIHPFVYSDAFLFEDYLEVSKYILLFLSIRYSIEFLLITLLKLREILSYFFFSKRAFSYSISIGLLILNIIYFYSFRNYSLFTVGLILLFSIRLFFILFHNKNLIIKELFYFILYLCAFELAPLFVLFKLIF